MFCCQFCEIFKNNFFIEHLRWLLLPILTPLDSQRLSCKWISKLVMIYFVSTFLVLVSILVFIFGECKLSFYISTALWLKKYDVFLFFNWQYNWSVTWLFGWDPFILSQHPTKFCGPWASWMWRQNVFNLSRDHMNVVSRDFAGGVPLS